MNQSLEFNVIIPTRERADTLLHCLRTVVAQDYERLNIIVSDNFSQDNTRDVVASFSDSRIKYINSGKRLSMSHNWEFALDHVTDGWVTFLGDDDGLLPSGLKRIAQVIEETGCRAVTSKWCHYYWPNSQELPDQLTIPMTAGFEIRESKLWLAKLLQGNALYIDLPWLYTGGFADSALINSARDASGKFFLSMIPDVYTAVALASITGSYVMLNEPVSVAGVSSHSTGTATLAAAGDQSLAANFFSEENIPFHPELGSGRVPSIPILIYECYLKAMHLHHDALKIDWTEQVALALLLSAPRQYATIRDYVEKIARQKGCDIGDILKKEARLRRDKWPSRLKPNFEKHWQHIIVNGRRFEVKDIHGAAQVSDAIYFFNKHYRNWRWTRFIGLLKYVVGRVFGGVRHSQKNA